MDLSAIPLTEPQKNVSVEEMTMIVPSGQFEQILLLKTTRKSEKLFLKILEGIKKLIYIRFHQAKSGTRQKPHEALKTKIAVQRLPSVKVSLQNA